MGSDPFTEPNPLLFLGLLLGTAVLALVLVVVGLVRLVRPSGRGRLGALAVLAASATSAVWCAGLWTMLGDESAYADACLDRLGAARYAEMTGYEHSLLPPSFRCVEAAGSVDIVPGWVAPVLTGLIVVTGVLFWVARERSRVGVLPRAG